MRHRPHLRNPLDRPKITRRVKCAWHGALPNVMDCSSPLIQMLQEKGIDPFDRGQVLDTLNSDKLATQQQIQLPQKIETSTLPAQVAAESVPSMANTRETEIAAI